jgi:predicted nucleotide-binding protein
MTSAALRQPEQQRPAHGKMFIFELGYFAGKLGRGCTCLMRKGAVEIPSDSYGVIYTEMDNAEGWKLKLVKELKAARLNFDANRMWG